MENSARKAPGKRWTAQESLRIALESGGKDVASTYVLRPRLTAVSLFQSGSKQSAGKTKEDMVGGKTSSIFWLGCYKQPRRHIY